MKVLIQRVTHGSVSVDGETLGRIGAGVVVLVGVRTGDTSTAPALLARKTVALRIFRDDQGRMNRSLADTGGAALVISQFTLYADTRKGNRPSFVQAGDPAIAETLYNAYVDELTAVLGAGRVQTGRFGAEMQVELVNDGPVTIELSTDRTAW